MDNIDLTEIIAVSIPIAVCVVLPVMVVWLTSRVKINRDNLRKEVLLKAIEANNSIDAEKLANAMNKKQRTPLEILNLRLLRGCIFSLLGISLIAVCIVLCLNGSDVLDEAAFISLMGGCGCSAVGISYLIVYFVTRSQTLASDHDSEPKE